MSEYLYENAKFVNNCIRSLQTNLEVFLDTIGFVHYRHAEIFENLAKTLEISEGALNAIMTQHIEKKLYFYADDDEYERKRGEITELKQTKEELSRMQSRISELESDVSKSKEEHVREILRFKTSEDESRKQYFDALVTIEKLTKELRETKALEENQKHNTMLIQRMLAESAMVWNEPKKAEIVTTLESSKATESSSRDSSPEKKAAESDESNPKSSDKSDKKEEPQTNDPPSYTTVLKRGEKLQSQSKPKSQPAQAEFVVASNKKRNKNKNKNPSEWSGEKLFKLDWRKIDRKYSNMCHFEVRRLVDMRSVENIFDKEIKLMYIRNSDTTYDFHGMTPASNGYFYRLDEENRYVLASFNGKFPRWDMSEFEE